MHFEICINMCLYAQICIRYLNKHNKKYAIICKLKYA